MKKVGIYSLIILLVFSMIPMPSIDSVSAESEEEETEEIVLFAEEEGDDINLYSSEEDVEADESEIDIPDESEALLIHNDFTFEYESQLYVYIQYKDEDIEEDTDQLVEGYVDAERVVLAEDVEEFLENRQQGEETESDENNSDEAEEAENNESSEDDDGNIADSEENDESVKEDEENTDSEEKDDVSEEEDTNASEENDESTDNNGKEKSPNEDSDNNDEESDDNKSEELDEEDEFTPSPYTTQNARNIVEKKTSKLARIKNSQVKIYEGIGGNSKEAGSQYTDVTYYVKKQATQGNETYFLLSTEPSAKKGTVGWVKEKDLSYHSHSRVDNKSKTFYLNGEGNTRSKAWGAKDDQIHTDLSDKAGELIEVNKTEKVSNHTWYRGKINGEGENVWVHSKFVFKPEESKTSKLARVKTSDVKIYENLQGDIFKAGSKYTDVTFYVKKQAEVSGDTYYLLSTEPSAKKGTVGWVSEKDVKYHSHTRVDNKPKTFYLNGEGNTRSKAWGAKDDQIHTDLSDKAGELIEVNKTEKVSNHTWYRGKINGEGENVWLHSKFVFKPEESKTSKLARVKTSDVKIYENIQGDSFKAGSKYTDVTLYVKKQAEVSGEIYYLLSTEPSAKKGTVGWVHEKDIKHHSHTRVDNKSKTFYLNGVGNTRSKAWGAKDDQIHSDLRDKAGELIEVNKTEKVGNHTWYRGKIKGKGKNVWVHSKFVFEESNTSKLARIKTSDVKIYENSQGDFFKAGTKYTDVTFYVKKQAEVNGTFYYLISTEPSAKKGTVGWVHEKDVKYYSHTRVDSKFKTFYLNGKGNTRSKAWGAKGDQIHSDLSDKVGELIEVNKTEKVGNNTWYRGKINGKGKNVWVHSNFVDGEKGTIVIDAGHGGSDPGASGNGLKEKDITLDVSKRVKKMLESDGYTVVMTRTKDESVTLKNRTDLANEINADLFISIHVNSCGSCGATGIETWWYNKGHKPNESKKLAQALQEEVIKETNAKNRNTKNGNLHVNRESKMPSSLVEIGFIDDKKEANNLKKSSYKNSIAKGIVKGINKYLSL